MKPATRCILRTIGIEIALIFLALAIYTGGESDIGAEIFLGSLLIILPFALISFVLGYFAGERVVPFEELSPLVRFFLGVQLILNCVLGKRHLCIYLCLYHLFPRGFRGCMAVYFHHIAFGKHPYLSYRNYYGNCP